jgi:hypothetical protein
LRIDPSSTSKRERQGGESGREDRLRKRDRRKEEPPLYKFAGSSVCQPRPKRSLQKEVDSLGRLLGAWKKAASA